VQGIFADQMDYVFFVYGLAFFLLGGYCLTLRTDAFPRLPWRWLAAFALSHGAAEWLDLAVLGFGPAPGLVLVKTAVMTASFVFLLEFARRSLNRPRRRAILGYGLPFLLLSLVVAAGARGGVLWFDVAARYLLGLAGGLLAAAALYRTIPTSRSGTRPWLFALATFTAVYAVLAGAIPPRADLFLAEALNHQRFLDKTGVPIQVVRALAAMGMAIAMWVGSHLPAARAKAEEIPFGYALGLAGAMLVIVPGGWGLTEALTRQSQGEIYLRGSDQAHALARVVDKEMERAGQAAQLLSVSDAVREMGLDPSDRTLRAADQVLDQAAIAFRASFISQFTHCSQPLRPRDGFRCALPILQVFVFYRMGRA